LLKSSGTPIVYIPFSRNWQNRVRISSLPVADWPAPQTRARTEILATSDFPAAEPPHFVFGRSVLTLRGGPAPASVRLFLPNLPPFRCMIRERFDDCDDRVCFGKDSNSHATSLVMKAVLLR
jgi:hypothetical protein